MKTNPNPMGCALCGIDQRGHAIQATADGSHTWTRPTEQQIKDRMLTRKVRHSGPDTKFCVLCLSGEHERVDDEPSLPAGPHVADRESEDGA
jgi:hypothetical protein